MNGKGFKPGEGLLDKFKTDTKQAQIAAVSTVNGGGAALDEGLGTFADEPDVEQDNGESQAVKT